MPPSRYPSYNTVCTRTQNHEKEMSPSEIVILIATALAGFIIVAGWRRLTSVKPDGTLSKQQLALIFALALIGSVIATLRYLSYGGLYLLVVIVLAWPFTIWLGWKVWRTER